MTVTRDKIILALFLAVPFAVWFTITPVHHVHEAHRYALLLAAVVVVGWLSRNPWARAFAAYAAAWQVALFTALYSGAVGLDHAAHGMSEMLFLAAGLALFAGVARSRIEAETVYLGIRIAAILQAVTGTLQIMKIDLIPILLSGVMGIARGLPEETMVGSLGNNNFLAAWLAISLPFFLQGRWRWLLPWFAFLLLWSHTTSAVVPAGVAVAVYVGLSRGRMKIVLAGIGAAVLAGTAYFWWDDAWHNTRFDYWTRVIGMILESPATIIFGHGPGAAWGEKFPMHNEWLELAFRYGAIGVCVAGGFLRSLDASRPVLVAALVAACINMAGNYPLHLAPSAFLIILIAGLMWREREREMEA